MPIGQVPVGMVPVERAGRTPARPRPRARRAAACRRLMRSSRTRSNSRGSNRGPRDQIGQQRRGPARRTAPAVVIAEQRRVGSDLGVEAGAEPTERLVKLQRRQRAAALVEHVAGDGGQAWQVGRIVGRTGGQQQDHVEDRARRGARRSRHAGRWRARARRISGKVKVGSGPRAGELRRSTAITTPTTGTESCSARAMRPRGTTLSATRFCRGGASVAASTRSADGGGQPVALQIRVEVIRVVRGRRCRR